MTTPSHTELAARLRSLADWIDESVWSEPELNDAPKTIHEAAAALESPTPPERVIDKSELKRLVALVFGEEFQIVRQSTPPTAPAQDAQGVEAFDKAVAEELPRVSHLEYDSHEICKHFAGKVRDRLAALRASSPAEPREPLTKQQIWDALRPLYGSDGACAMGSLDDIATTRAIEASHGIVTKESSNGVS